MASMILNYNLNGCYLKKYSNHKNYESFKKKIQAKF